MRYMCLVYQDEEKVHAMAEEEYQAIVGEVREQRETLRESNHLILSSPLEPVACATTIRVRHGKMSITDGPFAETKEQLGGFYLIEARDLNEAIRLVSRMPPARLGCIEIRPLQELGGRPRPPFANE